MRILALIGDVPGPPITGSRVRNFYLWPAVRKLGHEVMVLGVRLNSELSGEYGSCLEDEFFFPERRAFFLRVWSALTRSHHERFFSETLRKRILTVVHDWSPHVIHAEELRTAVYLPRSRVDVGAPLRTVTFHNVETDLLMQTGSSPFRLGESAINLLHLRSLRKFEHSVCMNSDLCFAYSETDLRRYKELYPDAYWAVTRNGTSVSEIIPKAQTRDPNILFVGALRYVPNRRGLEWFFKQVLPLLPERITVTVAGSGANAEIREWLNQKRVQFIDTPKDLYQIYSNHALSIVPLFDGSGTRGKILESLAHGRVVVSTSLGVQGLFFKDSNGVAIADTASEFASQIVKLVFDVETRAQLAEVGRANVISRYDWSIVARELVAAWEKCLLH
jgi:polysaccharide biosynthesis protein PslH